MRRKIEDVAAWLPAPVMSTLLGVIFTLVLANMTDSWLPGEFISAMKEYNGTSVAADSADFFRIVITAVSVYVLSIASCGMTIALALCHAIRLFWKMAGC